MDEVEQYARSNEIDWIIVGALSTNSAAISFYEKRNPVLRQERVERLSSVLMVKYFAWNLTDGDCIGHERPTEFKECANPLDEFFPENIYHKGLKWVMKRVK